jgi:eukaryotic-like serine/threonine-protein kinase
MSSDRRIAVPINAQRIQVVFLAASEIEGPAERAKFLDGACDGNADLRSRVEALLRAHNESDSLLDKTALAPQDHAPTIAYESGAAADDEVPLGFLAPATRPDSLGRIGHYEVLQVLGQGGFGIVFRAFDDVLHRVVAVKVLSPQMAATSPARKRFLREARSSAQVRHENVVQVYEVGEQPLPYIAMEFIPGETLQQRLDRTGPIDVVEVVRIGRQIAEGLAAAHATDLIHRDIKPGNILLEGGQLRVKITDFGLARAADDASMSQSGIIAGTPMFMAPEQARGETLDQRADLFGLGSVLYVMAAGRPPFRANGTLAVLKRVAEDTPRPIREIIPETPQWLCDIIVHLQAKNPADRFQSAREVADLLADCEAQLKANSRLKDFSRIPRNKQLAVGRSGRRKWGASAAAVLLPVLALAVTEISGVSNLFRGQQVTNQPKAAKQPTPPKLAVGPYTDADAQQIAASTADEQIEQVRKELVRRNPGFDGKVDLKIEDGVVAELWINTDKVTDISPIRVFNALRVLNLSGTHTDWRGNSQLSDLTPLKGMPFDRLTYLDLAYTKVTDAGLELFKDCTELSHLNLDDTKVSDAGMESFKNCKALTFLFIGDTQVGDSGLAHFQNCTGLTSMNLANTKVSDAGMKHLRNCKNLEWINLSETKIGDAGIGQLKDCKSLGHINMAGTLVGDAGLASLKDCKKLWLISLDRTQVGEAGLAYLKNCMGLFTCSLVSTKVTDLSMLKELPLRTLFCDFNAHRDAKILRSMKTLEQINGKPVAEFWKDVDAR